MKALYVLGTPSYVGGADTELMHQILGWRKAGIDVHVVPNYPSDINSNIKEKLQSLGCHIQEFSPEHLTDKVVVSYCNGVALKRLRTLKPRAFIWFNCMTWPTDDEIENILSSRITHLGFVSQYQEAYLLNEYKIRLPQLCKDEILSFGVNGFPKKFPYTPYLEITEFPVLKKSNEYFGVGRISRADPAKFSEDCWQIFDRILCPRNKRVFILGYSKEVEQKIGTPPSTLNWKWWTAGAIPSQEFYGMLDVLVHKTGGSRESYGRVLIEAMAHGIVPLVERDYAFPEILCHDAELANFIMCNSSEEMSYKASQLAFDDHLLIDYKRRVRKYVERCISQSSAIHPWLEFLAT